ncbi:hypothetical protein LPJ53_001372 [Coemansia erecta]|uniref:Thioredoxin-like fold domain-containing protein n=1 Tax=Coemansia erecta TaxID=147472 RepID=A0A9W7Y4G7_9FUNG|nr:hypothetical protein LPJ53_001372 [Coemansia erecta]
MVVPTIIKVSEPHSLREASPTMEQMQEMPLLPLTPTSPGSGDVFGGGRQRTIQLGRTSGDTKPSPLPWLQDKGAHGSHQQLTPACLSASPTGSQSQRLRLPKRRMGSTERSNSSATVVDTIELDTASPLTYPVFNTGRRSHSRQTSDQHTLDMSGSRDGRSSFNSLTETIKEEAFPFMPDSEPEPRSRGTRSMSMVRGHIALSASSRTSLTHRLSQSIHQVVGPRNSTSPTLPIATRPRFHSTAWSTRSYVSHRQTPSVNLDTYDEGSAELTIRLSMDASQSRSYRMLLEGDSVISDLCVLEDEHQRTISAVQAGFGRKLIGLYFAATWSADCDEFSPVLQGLSSANRDDLVIVHVSVDNHPADMARLMAGSGWLSVPWTDRKLRQDLIERMGVSIAELPKLVIIDGTTHHIVSASGKLDVERRPLTCVREWKKNRAGLSWWNKSKTW